ncbi:multiple sugar ABC transporter ATP-binding protein [Mesomycoplasma conjunctivae]|nr:ABC transporter ATP-binding protein [Mesomycoplasma conjunctivae]VEU66323.1 multiple sugar ABC transporter ATP-binding protein [Mesomycoplasma conjunctivae]
MMNKNLIIEIENLNFSYDKKYRLTIDKLAIPERKIVTILGPSGSGKTTLLNLIAGFLDHKKAIKNKAKSLENIGYIMQKDNLYNQISVIKNLWISAKNSKKWRWTTYKKIIDSQTLEHKSKEKIKSLIDHQLENLEKNKRNLFANFKLRYWLLQSGWLFLKFYKVVYKEFLEQVDELFTILEIKGIENKKASDISGGQQQRVAFAKAIIKGNNFILMDEPFASLDAKIKESTIKWLEKIKQQFDLSIIFVTHDQVDALKISDLVILLKDGKVEQYGSPQDLFENPNNTFVAKFIGFPEINFIGNDNEKQAYIRSKYLKIEDFAGNAELLFKKNIGDGFWVKILDKEKNIELELVINNDLKSKDLNVVYQDEKILYFDKQGQRIHSGLK